MDRRMVSEIKMPNLTKNNTLHVKSAIADKKVVMAAAKTEIPISPNMSTSFSSLSCCDECMIGIGMGIGMGIVRRDGTTDGHTIGSHMH